MAKKSSKNSKKKNTKKKKFYEYFKISKNGKEKTVKKTGVEVEKVSSKKQLSEENKILRNFFIVLGLLLVLFIGGYFVLENMRNFEYEGVDFSIVKFCDVKPCLYLYQTKFPVISNGEKAEYNMYLRNDPRELDNITFEGELNILPTLVLNSTNDFNCEGDGIIAVANVVRFYELVGTRVVKNESVSCGEDFNYTYVNIQSAEKNSVEKFGLACYNINVKDCDILKSTERFLLESFVEVNKHV